MEKNEYSNNTPEINDGKLPMPEFVAEVSASAPRGALIGYAAKICIMYAYAGAPATAKFVNKKFGSKYSTRPIIDLVDAVAAGEVIVTNREIWKVAKEDPATEALIERFRDALSGDYFDGRLIAQMNPRKRKKGNNLEVLRDITGRGAAQQPTPSSGRVVSKPVTSDEIEELDEEPLPTPTTNAFGKPIIKNPVIAGLRDKFNADVKKNRGGR